MSRARKGPTSPGFRIYRDRRGEWRWRLVAANGQIVATPGEGYTRRADCVRSIEAVKALVVSVAGVPQWNGKT